MPQKKQKEGQKDEKGFSVRSCFRSGDGVFSVDFSIGTGKSDEAQAFRYVATPTPLDEDVRSVG
jgi:hypothetical protein